MNDVIDVDLVEKHETAIAVPVGGDLSMATPEEIDRRVEGIERAAKAHKRMVAAGLHLCNEDDWKMFGEKLHLLSGGAQRLLALGIRLSTPVFDVRSEGEDVIVDCVLEAQWPAYGKTMTEVGSCSTRDKFYFNIDPSKQSQYAKYLSQAEGNRELAMKLLQADVKKKAYANAQGRVVSGILGIRGLTLAQLKEAGLGTGKIKDGAVNFGKGATPETVAERSSQGEFVPLAGLNELAVGSKVQTAGTVVGTWERNKHFSVGCEYALPDGQMQRVYFKYWKVASEMPDWLKEGADIVIDVKVGEFKGDKQFQAEHIEQDQRPE